MSTVGVVIAVRNEEESIPRVLGSLASQTATPVMVAVVDDGSNDTTPNVLQELKGTLPYDLEVATLPYHKDSKVGKPALAKVFNEGLALLRHRQPVHDYVMILGADHTLPPDYLKQITAKLEQDPHLAVAAGWIVGEPYWEHAPRGSSMVVRTSFWEEADGIKFPVNYGWESWVYLKASEMGYETRAFRDVPTRVARKTSVTKGILYGRAMYALGYYWAYVVGRSLLVAPKSPKSAVQMLVGYFGHAGVQRMDVSGWVTKSQRRLFARRAYQVVTRLGRR